MGVCVVFVTGLGVVVEHKLWVNKLIEEILFDCLYTIGRDEHRINFELNNVLPFSRTFSFPFVGRDWDAISGFKGSSLTPNFIP